VVSHIIEFNVKNKDLCMVYVCRVMWQSTEECKDGNVSYVTNKLRITGFWITLYIHVTKVNTKSEKTHKYDNLKVM
jgi:hypothetical protein